MSKKKNTMGHSIGKAVKKRLLTSASSQERLRVKTQMN